MRIKLTRVPRLEQDNHSGRTSLRDGGREEEEDSEGVLCHRAGPNRQVWAGLGLLTNEGKVVKGLKFYYVDCKMKIRLVQDANLV